MSNWIEIDNDCRFLVQVKIWFQNRRYKTKRRQLQQQQQQHDVAAATLALNNMAAARRVAIRVLSERHPQLPSSSGQSSVHQLHPQLPVANQRSSASVNHTNFTLAGHHPHLHHPFYYCPPAYLMNPPTSDPFTTAPWIYLFFFNQSFSS